VTTLRGLRRTARRSVVADPRASQRGVGLIEFTLVLPVFLLLLLVMLEFGLAFNHHLTLGYASREGARTGSALGNGGASSCSGPDDPAGVDQQVIAALQRILKSPGSDVVMTDISAVRIYKANSAGAQIGSSVNVWTYTPGAGPDIDDSSATEILDFSEQSVGWPTCSRDDTTPDSIGVRIDYSYRLNTPLATFVNGFLGGSQAGQITMNDQTVMAINPSTN
jgi:hypothetical protein